MTIDLDHLESLAKAATSGRPGDRIPFAIHALDPEGILELCAEVRMLREVQAANVEIKAALNVDAQRYRWLQRQRSDVWHEFADVPVQRTNELIDEELAKERQ